MATERLLILIIHNVRSTHNVGSMLRTADGLGVSKVYLTGYTPYPQHKTDDRLPFLAESINKRITKTSLGAEHYVDWEHCVDISKLLRELHKTKYEIVALEQSKRSIPVHDYKAPDRVALIVGREIGGIELSILDSSDAIIEIPMKGKKESFNVSVAAAIALFAIRA